MVVNVNLDGSVRCDSADQASNICSHCISFNLECTHRMAEARVAKRTGKQPEERNNTTQASRSTSSPAQPAQQASVQLEECEIEDAKAHISAILSTSYKLTEDHAQTLKALVQISCYARHLEGQLARAASASPPAAHSLHQPSNSPEPENLPRPIPFLCDLPRPKEDEAERDIPLSEPLRQLHFGFNDAKDAYYGKGSNVMLLKTAFNVKAGSSGKDLSDNSSKRPDFWGYFPWQQQLYNTQTQPFDFPDVDLIFPLVALYFEKLQSSVKLLHRPSFERSVYEGLYLRNRAFGALLLTVCALGARFSDDPRVFIDPGGELSAGWKWITQLRPFEILSFGIGIEPSVYEIQAICNYIIFLQPTTSGDLTWPLVALGLRYAHVAGAHRRHFMQNKPLAEQELWKRAFWVLIAIDTYSSAFYGRPRCTTPIDYNQEFPLEVDDEYWEDPDPDKCFKQPPDKPSTITFWVQFLKILRVLGIAQRSYLGLNKRGLEGHIWGIPEDEKVLTELDSLLNLWIDQLPEHLRWKPDQPDSMFFNQSATIHSVYYWIQIQIHRPFISVPGQSNKFPNLSYSSLAVCSNAARSCIRLLDIQSKKGTVDWTTGQLCYGTHVKPVGELSIGVINRFYKTSAGHTQVHHDFETIRATKAGGLIDIITEILTITEIPSANACTTKKRSRSDDNDNDECQVPQQEQGKRCSADIDTTLQYPPYSDDWWLNMVLDASLSAGDVAGYPNYVELPLYTEDLSGPYFDMMSFVPQDGAGNGQQQLNPTQGSWGGPPELHIDPGPSDGTDDTIYTTQPLPPLTGNEADLWLQAIGGDPWEEWVAYFGVNG
ncbi:Gypsy retrotransposon integrase-like protein 1 [Marasmius sp. AFHP31]|nr:Gypsy retrotransposon integrase-like protein 1 [Marasmius sp. AFHP31]